MAMSPTCTLSDSGYLINEREISKVYICTSNESEFKENVSIKVKTADEQIEIISTINYGYDPSVFLGDFIGNGLDQIFYSVNSGGSGAYSASQIISLQGGRQKTVYDSVDFKNTAKAVFEGDLIKIEYLNQYYFLDASNADLGGKKEIVISDVNAVMPVYNVGLEKFQIIQYQKVYVDYTANNIGYLVTVIDISDNGARAVSAGTLTNYI